MFWLAIHHDIVISKSALHLNLKEAGLSRKLLHKIAIERDAQLREEYMDTINGELEGDSSMLVFVDETSKNDHTLSRRYGLALAERGLRSLMWATLVTCSCDKPEWIYCNKSCAWIARLL